MGDRSQEAFLGRELRALTTVGLIPTVRAVSVAVTALPVGDTRLGLMALKLKPAAPSKLGRGGGGGHIC